MQLKEPIFSLLEQLQYLLERITNEQYVKNIAVLSDSSIGQHIRHTLEFFIELENGYENGTVDYDKRIRNHAIESDRDYAIGTIILIRSRLVKINKDLKICVEYGVGEKSTAIVATNYFRELVYNLEHTVHHMAIIRIGVNAIAKIKLPAEFGIAASTLNYRNVCAQ